MTHVDLSIPDWPFVVDVPTEGPPVLLWLHLEGVELMVVRDPFIISSFLIPPGLLYWWTI